MQRGTVVLGGTGWWLLALACLGCAGSPVREEAAPPARTRPPEPPPPAPILRIPEPPAPTPSANPSPAVSPTVFQLPSPSAPEKDAQPEDVIKPTSAPVRTPDLEASADPAANLHRLQRQATERAAQLDSYIARLRRREQVNGKDGPEEIILFRFRRDPFSVHMKWLGTVGTGREVIYVKGRYEDKIHTLVARSDNPIFAGQHMSFALDNPMVRDATRRPITDAGLTNLVVKFTKLLDANDHGNRQFGTCTYLGRQKRPEFSSPLEVVEQIIPPQTERWLDRGGRRLWFFEPKEHLPMLAITADDTGHEVEYYCYDYLQWPVKLDEEDFNPSRFDAKKK